jgi:mRNA interferase MazF
MSNDAFNKHTGLCIVCPITTTYRDHPFHVAIPEGSGVEGFIMVEQVKSVDFRSRRARRIGQAPAEVLDEALSLLDACIY